MCNQEGPIMLGPLQWKVWELILQFTLLHEKQVILVGSCCAKPFCVRSFTSYICCLAVTLFRVYLLLCVVSRILIGVVMLETEKLTAVFFIELNWTLWGIYLSTDKKVFSATLFLPTIQAFLTKRVRQDPMSRAI